MAKLRLSALGCLCALSLGGCSAGAPEEVITSTRSPIVNGTEESELTAQVFDQVAVYHPGLNGAPWFPRPCSGMLVRSSVGFSYVLTARHCVTSDLSVNGPLVAPTSVRVLPGARPGLAAPNPPAAAVVGDDIQAMPISTAGPEARDIAMIRVRANWAPFVTKFGMAVSAPNTFNSLPLFAFGYGINTFDTGCFDHTQNTVTTGAGIARFGASFIIASGSAPFPDQVPGGFYSYVNRTGGNPPQSVICGDSGGPDLIALAGAFQILGVHSEGTFNPGDQAVSTAAGTWVEDTLGGLYLSPDSMANYNFSVTSSWVPFLDLNTNINQTLRYDPATQRINAFAMSRCLVPAGGEPMAPCQDIPLQRWAVGSDRRIIHVQSGLCLTAANIQVFGATCNDSPAQRWQFHAQKSEQQLYDFCANENGQCSFSGRRDVRYGAFPNFVYRTISNGTPCNNATFGDPFPGIVKQCSIGLRGFNFCANENGQCSFSGTRLVAYGANGIFLYKTFTNGTPCNNATFTDPLAGVVKSCFVSAT
jgi:hypothetical protein